MRAMLTVLIAAILVAGCTSLDPPAPPGTPGTAGQTAKGPEWSFVDTEGIAYSRDAPAGNATVLFFMASWCGTCRTKAPLLAKVHADVAPAGVRFYSVSFDATDDAASLRKWKQDRANPWPHGVDPGLAIQRTFGVVSQSSVVVLDGNGTVIEKWGYGGVTEPGLRDAVARA